MHESNIKLNKFENIFKKGIQCLSKRVYEKNKRYPLKVFTVKKNELNRVYISVYKHIKICEYKSNKTWKD